MTHPGLVLKEEDNNARVNTDEYQTKCHLRYQQADIKVYTHFVAPEGTRNQYMGHRKALLDVTDLVKGRLRVADSSIAMLDDSVVVGVKPGRTEIQASIYHLHCNSHASSSITCNKVQSSVRT